MCRRADRMCSSCARRSIGRKGNICARQPRRLRGTIRGLIDDTEEPADDERVARAAADAALDQRDALVPGPLHIKGLGEISIVATEGDRIRVRQRYGNCERLVAKNELRRYPAVRQLCCGARSDLPPGVRSARRHREGETGRRCACAAARVSLVLR